MMRRAVVAVLAFLAVILAWSLSGCGTRARTADSRTFRFTYALEVRSIPAGARELSIWVPVPKTDRHQEVRELRVTAPVAYAIEHEKEYGNSILHVSAEAPLPERLEIELEALVERHAYNVLQGSGDPGAAADPPEPRDLAPNRLVPTHGIIAELAQDVTRGETTPLAQARAIYDYVTDTMRYDKSGTGWGRGDALYACDARAGNCTDFHSLIVGMARASGIPARFVMGFPLPEDQKQGEIPGYHCWAEVYVQGTGWLPMDSSEANKHPEKRQAFFGGLDANRVQFSLGRDLELEPAASEQVNFFVYPHVEVDGMPYEGVTRRFSFAEVGA